MFGCKLDDHIGNVLLVVSLATVAHDVVACCCWHFVWSPSLEISGCRVATLDSFGVRPYCFYGFSSVCFPISELVVSIQRVLDFPMRPTKRRTPSVKTSLIPFPNPSP